MSEELGRIERPSAAEFRAERKLYFVPLVFSPREPSDQLGEQIDRYWDQVDAQVANLERKLASVDKVYHELVPVGGEDGAKAMEELNKGSYKVAQSRLARGAKLQPIEDSYLLAEFMDWSRCLAVGLQTPKVWEQVYGFYTEALKKRNEYIAQQIDKTLESGQAGILLMREGHQVQFSQDIQVFYVSPPALDEIERWLREHSDQTAEAEDAQK
ncbi:MAG: hypothetical protein HYU86_04295 [Chloroflexi bacterium]|nr:hypothetical protein [Chloroflexota bacterium]